MEFDLSVIIPVYNAEKSIEGLISDLYDKLKSIQFEVILVNDASLDQSATICKQLVEK